VRDGLADHESGPSFGGILGCAGRQVNAKCSAADEAEARAADDVGGVVRS
jgi:hypothetical protein